MDYLCVYSDCDRKFVSSEWLARHLERDHAFPPGAARNARQPEGAHPHGQEATDAPVAASTPGSHATVTFPPQHRASRVMTAGADPTPVHRHKWVRNGEHADPSLPYESDVCLICGGAERVRGQAAFSRPIIPGPTATEPSSRRGSIGGTPQPAPRLAAPVRTRTPSARRRYWREAQRRHRAKPILTIPESKRCPGRGPRPEQGWLTRYGISCGVAILPSRDRCAFHRKRDS